MMRNTSIGTETGLVTQHTFNEQSKTAIKVVEIQATSRRQLSRSQAVTNSAVEGRKHPLESITDLSCTGAIKTRYGTADLALAHRN